MSQFKTYQDYNLANRLIKLESQWNAIKNNQIYSLEQGKLFSTLIVSFTENQDFYDILDYKVTFPVEAFFCIMDVYYTRNGVRYRYIPRNYGTFQTTEVQVYACNPDVSIDSDLADEWIFPIWFSIPNDCELIEFYCVSNVKPLKIERVENPYGV